MANSTLIIIIAVVGILGWAFFFYMGLKLIQSRRQEMKIINDILTDISKIKNSVEKR